MSPRRIGMLVPSSNVTMETELPRMLAARSRSHPDDEFTFHSARMRMTHVSPEQLQAMNVQTTRAAAELADLDPDVVVSACLVAIMAQGPGHHCVAESDIASAWDGDESTPPVVTSAGALLDGLRAIGASSVAIVTPYAPALTQLVVEYLESDGIRVVDALSLNVTDNLAVAALDPMDLQEHVRRLDTTGADAVVLSACVQMPSLPAIAAVERQVDLPVLSAATATCYSMLTALGLDAVVPDAGYLLAAR